MISGSCAGWQDRLRRGSLARAVQSEDTRQFAPLPAAEIRLAYALGFTIAARWLEAPEVREVIREGEDAAVQRGVVIPTQS